MITKWFTRIVKLELIEFYYKLVKNFIKEIGKRLGLLFFFNKSKFGIMCCFYILNKKTQRNVLLKVMLIVLLRPLSFSMNTWTVILP